MDKEYIDREAALRAILGQPPDAHYPGWYADSIKEIPAADVAPVVHGEWIPTTKHKWETDENGKIEEYAWDHEFHNGPACVICGAHPCVYCNPAWEEDENCYEHFVCSICGRHEEVKHPYCHCGAKMDGGKE